MAEAVHVDQEFQQLVNRYQQKFDKLRQEIGKVVVGQQDIIDSLIEALLANGHVLVEGIPGIAKTLTVRTLARVTGSDFKRVQFTPDLLPTDIIGITTYEEGRGFYTIKGPVFSNFVLADEINRAPPKVQSALLEAMQEKQVTIGKQTFPLPAPFFVMATQNPVENLGTYPLPEAQVDRFLYKIVMTYPSLEDERKIMHQNMTLKRFEDFDLDVIFTPEELLQAQQDVKKVYLDEKVEEYIVRITDATRNPDEHDINTGKYIEYGASPRSTIAMFISGKAHALINGRSYVTPHDIKIVARNVLRHRLILNYEGQAENVSTDDVIDELLAKTPVVEKQ